MAKSTTQGPAGDLVMLSPGFGQVPDAGQVHRAVSPPTDLSKDDVTALYERANALREHGQLDEAIAAYSRAHDLEPGSSEILNNLGDAFRARGRVGEAIVACRSAIALRPDFAEAYNNLGNALRDQGKYDEAIAAYTKALQLRPDVHSIHNNLGIVLSIQGRLDEAMMSYATAIRLKPDYAKAHNNLGSVLRDKGRPDEAVRACQRAIELRPDFAQAYNNLGVALASMGRFGDAVGAYSRALELQPQLASVHQHLADAYRQTGQLANAITAYRRAIQLKPTNGMLHCNLGHALKDSGRIDEAIGAYIDSIRLKADSVEPYFNLGNALRDQGQYEQAADVYSEALKLRPNLATIHNHLGVVLNLSGKVNEAIDAFAAAVRLKPDYAKAHNNLGAALRDQGRFEEAVLACRSATALKPDYAMGHYNLGKALKDVGRLDDAIAAYRAAIRLQPNLAEAYNNLGNAYKERGQLDDAIYAYARAVELKPNLNQARFNLDFSRLEKTQIEKRFRGEIDVYELQPDAVDRPDANLHAVEVPATVAEVGSVVNDVPVEFILPVDSMAAAEEGASGDGPAAAEGILPAEKSILSPPSDRGTLDPILDAIQRKGDAEQSHRDDHALTSAILFEPPEARIGEGAAIDPLPPISGPIGDCRNSLMADVSDVFVPPILERHPEPGEVDLLTFTEEADERPLPLPPVSPRSDSEFFLTAAEPHQSSVTASADANVEHGSAPDAPIAPVEVSAQQSATEDLSDQSAPIFPAAEYDEPIAGADPESGSVFVEDLLAAQSMGSPEPTSQIEEGADSQDIDMTSAADAREARESGTECAGGDTESPCVSPVSIHAVAMPPDVEKGLSRPDHLSDPASSEGESFAPCHLESREEEPIPQTAEANPDRPMKASGKASRRRSRRQAAKVRRSAPGIAVADGQEREASFESVTTKTVPSNPVANDNPFSATALSAPIASTPAELSESNSVEAGGPSVEIAVAIAELAEVVDIPPSSNPDIVVINDTVTVDAPAAVHADIESAAVLPIDIVIVHPLHTMERSKEVPLTSDLASHEGFDEVPIGIVVSEWGEPATVIDRVSNVQTLQFTGIESDSVMPISAPTMGEFLRWDKQLAFDPIEVGIAAVPDEVQPADLMSPAPVESHPIDEEPIASEYLTAGDGPVLARTSMDDAEEAEPSSIIEQELVANPEAYDEPSANAEDAAQHLPEVAENGEHDHGALADPPTSEAPVTNDIRQEISATQIFDASEAMPDGLTPKHPPGEPISAPKPAPVRAAEPAVEMSLPRAMEECKSAAKSLAAGKLNQTIAGYRRALALWPALHDARGGLAKALEKKQKLTDAVTACEVAVSSGPDDADAYCHLAEAQRMNEQFDEAVISYQTAVELRPEDAETFCKLGTLLRDRGKRDEAKIAYRKALSIRADFREAHNNLLDLAFGK